MDTKKQPTEKEIRLQLDKILSSKGFAQSERGASFLRHIVEETLAGNEEKIKGYSIGIEVFDKPDDFDPDSDATVRVEASRIRKTLSLYYHEEGENDPVQIDIPKGSYKPDFSYREIEDCEETAVKYHIIFALLAFVLGGIIVFTYPITSTFFTSKEVSSEYKWFKPDIAVLPFRSIGSTAQIDVAGQLRKRLIDDLSRFKEVDTIDTDLAANFEDWQNMSASLDKAQDINYIIEGTVRILGSDKIRVVMRLIELQEQTHIWSYDEIHKFNEGNPAFINQLSDQIASWLISPYGVIQSYELQRISGVNDPAFHPYKCILGFYSYTNNKTAKKHAEIRDCLEKTVKAIPEYSSAWAWLSWIYGDEYRYGYNPTGDTEDIISRAFKAGSKGVETDPNNARAHAYMGVAARLANKPELVRHHINLSLKLNPNDAEIVANAAWRYGEIGDWENSFKLAQKAMSMAQGSARWYHGIIFCYYFQKSEYENALMHALEFFQPEVLTSHLALAASYQAIGDTAKARAATSKIQEHYPDFEKNPDLHMREWPFRDRFIQKLMENLAAAGLNFATD